VSEIFFHIERSLLNAGGKGVAFEDGAGFWIPDAGFWMLDFENWIPDTRL
jgi:hypothetical protein